MDITDTGKQTISVAERLLDWYEFPTEDKKALATLMPQSVTADVFHVRGGVNFERFFLNHLESPQFASVRQELLGQWRALKGRLSLEQAESFLLHHAQHSDHELFYRGEVAAGQTRAHRAVPASDYVTAYHAGRTAWTLHMTTTGAVDYIAGSPIRSQPGELLLFSPQASLHYKRSESSEEWTHYWALFEPHAQWLELMDWPLCTYGIYRLRVDKQEELETLRHTFESMVSLYESPPIMLQRLLQNLLEQFFIRAHQTQLEAGTPRTDARVLRACQFIENHIDAPIGVADIAASCNLSDSRLAHLFKENVGQSVKSFLDALRMQQAKRLLATTKLSISQVGDRVGYEDPAQFSKFFRRHMNCSPRTFRDEFAQ